MKAQKSVPIFAAAGRKDTERQAEMRVWERQMERFENHTTLAAEVLRKAAVADAWDRAVTMMPTLALLESTGGSLRRAMEDSVDNAIDAGVLDHDQLVEAAMARLPKLRTPNGQTAQHTVE